MTYLIALIVILIIIVLFLLLYSPRHKSDEEIEQHERLVEELTAKTPGTPEDGAGKSAPESAGEVFTAGAAVADPEEGGAHGTASDEAAGIREEKAPETQAATMDDYELTIDVADGEVAADEEHELDLTFVEEDDGDLEDAPELGFAPPGPEEQDTADSEEPELDLVVTEETGEVDLVLPAEDDIPFIIEDDDAPAAKAAEEVAPALSDVDGEAVSPGDDAPDDLTERLDSFFGGSDEDTSPDVAAVPGEEEVVAALADVDDETGEPAPAEAGPALDESPAILTLERYEAVLRDQKDWLRQQLDEAIEQMETIRLFLLENALTNVCGKLADLQAGLAAQQAFNAEIEGMVGLIRDVAPDFAAATLKTYLVDGDWRSAAVLLADTAAQLDENSDFAARLRYLAGRLAEEQAEFFLALEYYRGACESNGEAPEHLLAAGRLARIVGQEDEAEKWLEKLMASGLDGNDYVAVSARHELALIYLGTERKDRAEPLLKEALAGMEKLGDQYPALGVVAYDLAALYESSGMYEQAEPLYRKALEIMESGLGSEHPYLGATLNKLAGLYEELEQENLAEPLYARALEIKKEVLGRHHPDTGTILNNLANLLRQQGRYEEAETMFLRSLMIAEKALGKDHPNLAVVLNNIAELYAEMGNEDKAEQFQERAFALFELPGGGADFVEMEKDHALGDDDDANQKIAGS